MGPYHLHEESGFYQIAKRRFCMSLYIANTVQFWIGSVVTEDFGFIRAAPAGIGIHQ